MCFLSMAHLLRCCLTRLQYEIIFEVWVPLVDENVQPRWWRKVSRVVAMENDEQEVIMPDLDELPPPIGPLEVH